MEGAVCFLDKMTAGQDYSRRGRWAIECLCPSVDLKLPCQQGHVIDHVTYGTGGNRGMAWASLSPWCCMAAMPARCQGRGPAGFVPSFLRHGSPVGRCGSGSLLQLRCNLQIHRGARWRVTCASPPGQSMAAVPGRAYPLEQEPIHLLSKQCSIWTSHTARRNLAGCAITVLAWFYYLHICWLLFFYYYFLNLFSGISFSTCCHFMNSLKLTFDTVPFRLLVHYQETYVLFHTISDGARNVQEVQ